MDCSQIPTFRYLKLGLVGLLVVGNMLGSSCRHGRNEGGAGGAVPAQTQTIPPLSADDVSLLFPAPTRAEDFSKLIAVRDLTTQNAQDPTKRDPVWPDAVFQQFVAIANSPATQVAGSTSQIGLPAEAQSIDAWFIAGIRIDAGAPGLSADIRAQFGQRPEIRLIIQPVTRNPDGTPQIHDIAGHLIFDFTLDTPSDPALPGCSPQPRLRPDVDTFKGIVADLAALRTKLAEGQLGANKVTTAGVPLGVHPGLADATTATNVRQGAQNLSRKAYFRSAFECNGHRGTPCGRARPLDILVDGELPSWSTTGFSERQSPSRARSYARWNAVRTNA